SDPVNVCEHANRFTTVHKDQQRHRHNLSNLPNQYRNSKPRGGRSYVLFAFVAWKFVPRHSNWMVLVGSCNRAADLRVCIPVPAPRCALVLQYFRYGYPWSLPKGCDNSLTAERNQKRCFLSLGRVSFCVNWR